MADGLLKTSNYIETNMLSKYKGNIDWIHSVCKNINFKYNNICGTIYMVSYKKDRNEVSINE